jgi:hypothetical protein
VGSFLGLENKLFQQFEFNVSANLLHISKPGGGQIQRIFAALPAEVLTKAGSIFL